MEIEINIISKRLKSLREDKKITQEELAKDLGVSRQSVISLEQGKCLPSLPVALGFSKVFNLPLDYIFCIESVENNNRKEIEMSREISPWSPFRELTSLHETIDNLFEENFPVGRAGMSLPSVNVYETENEVKIEADLPGVKDEDITVEAAEDHVILKGERKAENEVEEKNFYRRETSFGSFVRTIPLPSIVDKDSAEAELKDGILTITLKKQEEKTPKVTRIKINKK